MTRSNYHTFAHKAAEISSQISCRIEKDLHFYIIVLTFLCAKFHQNLCRRSMQLQSLAHFTGNGPAKAHCSFQQQIKYCLHYFLWFAGKQINEAKVANTKLWSEKCREFLFLMLNQCWLQGQTQILSKLTSGFHFKVSINSYCICSSLRNQLYFLEDYVECKILLNFHCSAFCLHIKISNNSLSAT